VLLLQEFALAAQQLAGADRAPLRSARRLSSVPLGGTVAVGVPDAT